MSSDEHEQRPDDEEEEKPAMPAAAATATATARGRGKRLTDSERMEIIARLEDKTTPLSRAKCARLYGVTPAAISKLMKVSATVKKRYSDAGVEAGHLRDKRQRGGFSKNMCFEDELFKWIASIRARRIPLLVAHVQQKAKLLAAKHHMNDAFKASNGWYYRFCARYGLAPGSLHAGSGSSSSSSVSVALPTLPPASDSKRSRVDSRTHRMNTAGVGDSSDDSKELSSAGARSAKSAAASTVAVWSDDPSTAEKVGALQNQVQKFGPEFVYSLSEARLFYKLLPTQLTPVDLHHQHHQHHQQQQNGESEQGDSDPDSHTGGSATKGNTERVLVLVCANGTGTHKIPLLVVGKQARPSCFAVNNQHSRLHSHHRHRPHAPMQVGATRYVSQREVWCDNQTFQYWCSSVFAPSIEARTTQPVLLLLDNPGGSLEPFQCGNIATYFLPTRAGSLSAALQSGAASSSHAQFQPLQHGAVRELKRRYKIAAFHEALSFHEKGDEERYRLLQRAMNRPQGTAGIAFGRLPHIADAMALLEDAWSSIPVGILRVGWVRSNLYAQGFPEVSGNSNEQQRQEVSDDTVVLELCSMLRHVKPPEELHGLPKEIRMWLYADDDASERMQQELLHDVQRLLQEEEKGSSGGGVMAGDGDTVMADAPLMATANPNESSVVGVSASYEQHNSSFTGLMHSTSLQQQQVYGDLSSSGSSMGYGYSLPQQQQQLQAPQPHFSRQLLQHQPQQQHHHQLRQQQQQQQQHENPAMLREQRKSIAFALRALSNAEEALDNADVAEYFGEDTTSDALKAVGAVLRRLRRVHRGKQSTLPAQPPLPGSAADAIAHAGGSAAATREPAPSAQHAAASFAHAYFYGDAK